ncbi:hypothetical protein [Paraburkholderia strydomiana]|uniref:Uncharacterized protein n=1 Tax=Paraburkholderia strydomiana TaxID=1245417 RepID=A0ABW9C1F3_9BURK
MSDAPNIGRRGGLDARIPLALLPVRIETRFIDSTDGPELLVRIYPDQISVDAHEAELTAGEIVDARTYWGVVWRAGTVPPNDDPIRTAWSVLVSKYHAPRAAWIVRQTTPTNLAARPPAPTPEGQDPVPPPVFPTPPTRSTSWNRAARTVLLPDAWTVVAQHAGGTIVRHGAPIQADLAVTLDPSGAGAFPTGSTVDAGMQWMVDFDVAVSAGMALRIPLDVTTRATGFDAVFVYGMRNEGDSTGDLQSLIDAHHYSDGLSFVPQGSPTKNTPDVSSAWTINESTVSYAVEQLPTPPVNPQTDAARMTSALGFASSAGTFDRIAHGTDYGGRNGTDMLTALWPATLGYFLQQMMAPTFSYDQIDVGRRWALDHVIARGPLAAIRTGKTPYAVLPVTALRFYPRQEQAIGSAAFEPQLVAFLQRLLAAWTTSVDGAPHIGAGNPDQDLLHVLGMDASSMHFDGREILGQNFLTNWQIFAGIPDVVRADWWAIQAALAREAVTTYGSSLWNPFVLGCGANYDQFEIRYHTVTDAPLSETAPLNADAEVGAAKMNYIDWLRTASSDAVTFEQYPGGTPPTALLYKLLRQSLLREYADIASRREIADGRLTFEAAREPELVNVAQLAPTTTALNVLARPMPDHPTLTWAEFLVQVDATPSSPYARLGELRDSLTRLASLPTAELDRLFTETLDLCSHRLDAWLTGVVTAILQRTRLQAPTGLHVGAYGWVENVRPASPRQPITGIELEAVARLDASRASRMKATTAPLPVPQQPQVDNGGYIHAPSHAQAAAAAVLRAGYMSHKGATTEPLLSIDLSSKRVSRALWTLDGVRGGQRLSALLGYRFEAELDARDLQIYVQPFRDRFPMMGSDLTPTDPGAEAVGASDVVDALALRAAFDANQLAVGGDWGPGLPPPGSADQLTIVTLLAELDDIMDAVSDLSVSEAVFQVMRGNFERAGGLLDAVTKGSYAPAPQVIDTQRSGIDITHRVIGLLAGIPAVAPGWSTVSTHARAAMEPVLDAWVGTLLPDPTLVRCTVSHTDSIGTVTTNVVSLRDLDIGPLDFLAIADADGTPQRSELEERIRYHAALAPDIGSVTIAYASTGLPVGSVTFPDALVAARAVRALVGGARAVQPNDLCETSVDPARAGGGVVLAELQGRLTSALGQFDAALASIQSALAGLPAAPDPARATLLACSAYGIGGAIPATSSGPDVALALRATAVIAEMKKRRAAITAMPNATAADAVAIAKTLFGGTIVVLPRCTAPNAAILKAAFAASGSLLPSTAVDAPGAWIQQLTHVRPGIARLDAALTLAELLAGFEPPPFTFAQLPTVVNDRWLALPLDPAAPAPGSGRVALAALASGNLATAADFSGLVFDEWPERIPASKQSAAASFHYEEPKSRAPQALLLAVCPDARPAWDDELLRATLQETLQLAKIRTVDLASMIDLGQILPALYVPMNLQQATIATRFRMTAIEVENYRAIPPS